jgi:DUF971 family protein
MEPTSLSIENGLLVIGWSDGTSTKHQPADLRKACPCATCREKKRGDDEPKPRGILPVLTIAEAQPLAVQRMRPVGNYAYNIQFSDGHDSGIYSFDLIRSLAIGA